MGLLKHSTPPLDVELSHVIELFSGKGSELERAPRLGVANGKSRRRSHDHLLFVIYGQLQLSFPHQLVKQALSGLIVAILPR